MFGAALPSFLFVDLLYLLLHATMLLILYDQVKLLLVRVVDDFIEFGDVRVVELLHDRHFHLDVVKRVQSHRDRSSAQPLLIHDLHGVDFIGFDVEADEYFREGARADLLHDLVLIDSFFPADFG